MNYFFWFGMMFVLGVWLEPFWGPEPFVLLAAMTAIFLVGILTDRSAKLALLIMVFLLGTLRVSILEQNSLPEEGHLAGRVVSSVGRTAIIENREHRLEGLFYPKAPPLDAVVVVWYQGRPRISQLKGGVDIEKKVQRNRASLRKIKKWAFLNKVSKQERPEHLNSFEYGSVIWTFISGDKSGISSRVKDLMRRTGTSHLMAISGLHIGLVSGLIYWLARLLLLPLFFLGREQTAVKLPLLVAVFFAYSYGAQVGWPPSAQRAVVMVAVFSFGRFFEVPISLGDCLGLAAIVLLMREPAEFHSLSFQLSFSAVLGIALFLPGFRAWIPRNWHPLTQKILLSIGVTVGASLGTLPLVAWRFQEFAWVGFLSNLVVMPLMAGLAVPFSLISVLLPDSLALLSLCFADAAIGISMHVLELLEEEPIVLAFTIIDALLCAGLIFLIRCRLWFGFLFLVPCNHREQRIDGLEIRYLAIGQGDGSLIRWGDGRNWLVDGGEFSFDLVPYLRREGVFELEQVIISHPHPDHFGVLFSVLQELKVKKMVISRFPVATEREFTELISLAQEKGVEIELVAEWSEDKIQVYHPLNWESDSRDKVNEESIVFSIEYGEYRFLFTGDIEKEAEEHLLGKIGDVDVLKVAHHGSRSSSEPDFINELKPEFSVISCGVDNRFGHPHLETLDTLRHSKTLRTDWLGTIIFQTDGAHLSWKAE